MQVAAPSLHRVEDRLITDKRKTKRSWQETVDHTVPKYYAGPEKESAECESDNWFTVLPEDGTVSAARAPTTARTNSNSKIAMHPDADAVCHKRTSITASSMAIPPALEYFAAAAAAARKHDKPLPLTVINKNDTNATERFSEFRKRAGDG